MNTPNDTLEPTPNTAPKLISASTQGSAVGIFLAATLMLYLHSKGVDIPAGYEALTGAALSTFTGFVGDLIARFLAHTNGIQK